MPARVFEIDSSEAKALKKLLEYDPYLDKSKIPETPKEWDDPKFFDKHPELREEAEKRRIMVQEALKKLSEDKYANVIFARQSCDLREGAMLGLDGKKSYLYLKASDEFLKLAEEKLKLNLKSVKRASQSDEAKVIGIIGEEESKGNAGMGMIFGG
jgi:hypothetical protein